MADNKRNLATRWKNFRKNPDKATEVKLESWSSEEFSLIFHTSQFSQSDLILKQDVFQGVLEKEVLEIMPLDPNYPAFLVQVTLESFTNIANVVLSINSQLASVLGLGSLRFLQVKLRRLSTDNYNCEDMLVSIKNQHICRSMMLKCCEEYRGMVVYKGQLISKCGFRVGVSQLVNNGKALHTAVITANTKITFKSKSCRMVWMIEMAKEVWDFSPSGILYWEKIITFLTTAFERQIQKVINHDISIVIFAKLSANGKIINFYREILRISDLRNMWIDALKVIKREIMFFPALVNWEENLTCAGKTFRDLFPVSKYNDKETQIQNLHPGMIYTQNDVLLTQEPTFLFPSCETSFLESINYTADQLNKEITKNYTGNMIMVISAGTGLYFTSQSLAKMAKLLVLNQGISVSLMSMKRPPMHEYPQFIYKRELFEKQFLKVNNSNNKATINLQEKGKPHWLHVHFFFSFMQLEGTCNLQSAIHTQIHERPKRFQPLFRLPGANVNRIPYIQSSNEMNLKFDASNIPKSVNSIIFEIKLHSNRIFKTRKVHTTNEDMPRLRKGTSANPNQELSSFRKFSVYTSRKQSVGDQRSSIISNQGSYLQKKKQNSSLKQRWNDCFKVIKDCPEEHLCDEHELNDKKVLEYYESVWNSLLEPCLLPLYNDFWPLKKDMGVSNPEPLHVHSRITREQGIKNIIGSRLDLGYQIVKKNVKDCYGRRSVQPQIALSLGKAYHVINPDSNDEISFVYNFNFPEVSTIEACASLTLFDPEYKTFREVEQNFTFTYPTKWENKDYKLLGHS